MPPRFVRAACAAIVLTAGLVSVPACKKKKPPASDTPDTPAQGSGQSGSSLGPPPSPSNPGAPPGPRYGAMAAPQRQKSAATLTQIGVALHNFESANGGLPSALLDKTGKPGLSWRVAILPYLEQDGLYKQFKLDEPWDSPHNKALVGKMPKAYDPLETNYSGFTFYRGFSGPGTWLPPAAGGRAPRVTLNQFTDGTSNTILVAEAAEAVPWTKPEEMEFAPNKVPQIGGAVFSTGANVLVANGSVKFLPKGFEPQKLALLIQLADGQVVSWE